MSDAQEGDESKGFDPTSITKGMDLMSMMQSDPSIAEILADPKYSSKYEDQAYSGSNSPGSIDVSPKKVDIDFQEADLPAPLETVQEALKTLNQIDYKMVEMLGNGSALQRVEDRLRDLRSFLLQGSEEALRALADDADHMWRDTWRLLHRSEDSGNEYVVSWGVGSKWREHQVSPDYGCTCESFHYKQTGEYCKHIEKVIAEHGSRGNMPPMAQKTGQCLILEREVEDSG